MRIKQRHIATLLSPAITCAAVGFVPWDWDVANWSADGRSFLLGVCLIVAAMVAICPLEFPDE